MSGARREPAQDEWRLLVQEAIDLLTERKYGNPARSPGHNARLMLQDALAAAPTPPAAEAPGQEPVAFMYRWKIDGVFVKWRVSDASQRSKHLRLKDFQEVPLYAAPPTYADAEAKIGALVDALQNLLTLDQRCGWHSKEADAALALLRSLASPAPKGET